MSADAVSAVASSFKKTIMIEEELVRKSKKTSAALFRDRWNEMERTKRVSV